MTHEEAIAAAKDAEWEVIASSRGMCGENHPFEAGLRAYLTARGMVLMPRECDAGVVFQIQNAGDTDYGCFIPIYVARNIYAALIAEMDRREKRG